MSLQGHEEFGQPADPMDVSLLADDLAQTIRMNVGACAIHMPHDFTKPADVVLAGTIMEEESDAEVVIAQRATAAYLSLDPPRDEQVSYVVQFRRGEDRYTCLVRDGQARHVWTEMPALSAGYVMFFRAVLNPQIVRWSAESSHDEARSSDPYMWVRHYDKPA